MFKIEFHDREMEIEEIMGVLNTQPTLITFIYGPINSGKTELIQHLIKDLPENYKVFYINLRGRFIKGYEDFLEVLFEVDEKSKTTEIREYSKAILKNFGKVLSGIPIPSNLIESLLEKKEKGKDVFKYIEILLSELSKKFVPVLIVDELQVIGDVKIDDLLIYKLFNFFIRLTKEKHVCHIFAITSDALFIERVFSEAMLQGRCRFLKVDDFDRDTVMKFVSKYNFSEEEKEIAWNYCSGKPVCLIELITAKLLGKDVDEKAKEMLKVRKGQIEELIYSLEEKDREMFEKAVKILSEFFESEIVSYKYLKDEIRFLVGKNILFANPVDKVLKPQSRLDLLAIREVVKK